MNPLAGAGTDLKVGHPRRKKRDRSSVSFVPVLIGLAKRGKLSALTADGINGKEETRLGSLKILNAIKGQSSTKKKGLMFADVYIAGAKTKALVDTVASHLFISEVMTKKLGLKVEKSGRCLKTVNSKEIPMGGLARVHWYMATQGNARRNSP